MQSHIPTTVGDVLILGTDQSFHLYAIGLVTEDGQQDFRDLAKARYSRTRTTAIALAKTTVPPGHQIFLRDLDQDDWTKVST